MESCKAVAVATEVEAAGHSRPFAVDPSRSSAGKAGHRFPLRLCALASLR